MARLGPVLRQRVYRQLIVLGLIVLALPASAAARTQSNLTTGTPVPAGFVGMDGGGPLSNDNVDLGHQLDEMVTSGVQSVRVVFNWSAAQPYKSPSDVPPIQQGNFVNEGGVPTRFDATDKIVGLAAARGLTVLPTVLFAPGWDQGQNRGGGFAPPADAGPYANYLTALIDRYGPHGSFWQSHHPRMAIRSWQIWNEPNITAYWPQPFARSYVTLLRAAHAAVKRADPQAKVVLGAITNKAWRYLGKLYAIHGASKLFDVISVNGFTSTPNKVITFLQLVRRAANHLGDPRKPLLATELSWPSSSGQPLPQFDWDTTKRGQARKISALLPLLAANRRALRLDGFFYYTWVTQEEQPGHDNFNFAGLLSYSANGHISEKPALAAYRNAALSLEHCRKKGGLANRCAKRA